MGAFNLFSMGAMPAAISASISRAVASLVPNNLDDGNIMVVFFIIAGLGVLRIALFIAAYWCAREDVSKIGREDIVELADTPKQAEEGSIGNPTVRTTSSVRKRCSGASPKGCPEQVRMQRAVPT